MVKLIKMKREDGHKVDVHPNEIENYKAGGYEVVTAQKHKKVKPDAIND